MEKRKNALVLKTNTANQSLYLLGHRSMFEKRMAHWNVKYLKKLAKGYLYSHGHGGISS